MRTAAFTAPVVAATFLLAGCGGQAAEDGSAADGSTDASSTVAPTPSASVPSTPSATVEVTPDEQPVSGPAGLVPDWDLLNREFTAYSHKVMVGDIPSPERSPENVSGGFQFSEGVTLVSHTPEEGWCLSGPHDTYLNVSTATDKMIRSFGSGSCTVESGEVVLHGTFFYNKDKKPTFVERAVAGDGLAAQIPSLDSFRNTMTHTLRAIGAQTA
jgi:hypothetical protein